MKAANNPSYRALYPGVREERERDFITAIMLMMVYIVVSRSIVVASADNFIDVFYTSGFRGSFEWFQHFDWVGMAVQAVISVFSLVGTALIIIRIMTSLLYLSARGLWEEVHDLKQSGGESEFYDFGMINMAKTWAKGKAGTGLDAIFGAVLVLLPDVRRYSDFGEKSGNKFDEDTSTTQYFLKILLPTVMSLFFLAMAFNGTLMKFFAITVDGMGAFADQAVSTNIAGFVEDLVNQNSGYTFIASMEGTEQGDFVSRVQKDIYGRVVSKVRGASPAQFFAIGQKIESLVTADALGEAAANSTQVSPQIRDKFGAGGAPENDKYWGYIGYHIGVSGKSVASEGGQGVISYSIGEFLTTDADVGISGDALDEGTAGTYANQYINIYIQQTRTFDGSYLDTNQGGVEG